jgi:hypothetical protein
MAARELEPSLQRIHRLSVPFVSPLFDGLRREIVIAELMNCFGRRNRNDSRNINITAFLHGLVSRVALVSLVACGSAQPRSPLPPVACAPGKSWTRWFPKP